MLITITYRLIFVTDFIYLKSILFPYFDLPSGYFVNVFIVVFKFIAKCTN